MIKSEYFSSPVYTEQKPDWIERLDKLCDPYIKHAREEKKEDNQKRLTQGYKNDIGQTYHSHPLEPNESNENRYSIAFNFFVRGKFGKEEYQLELK